MLRSRPVTQNGRQIADKSDMEDQDRRRVPRRKFDARAGVLYRGSYSIEQTYQVGEGGMRISSEFALLKDELIVVTFQIPGGSIICIRAVVRYSGPKVEGSATYGVQFENLDFVYKRELRNFVASASQIDIT